MKKMMIALAGIVSVMMLASCQKEVEIDGDVSTEKTEYRYRMEITGTGSYVPAEWDKTAKKWKAVEGAEAVELVANRGWLSWDDSYNSNEEDYAINTWYNGDVPEGKKVLQLKELFPYDDKDEATRLKKYREVFYLPEVGTEDDVVTVTGSPRDKKFTVEMKDRHAYIREYGPDENGIYQDKSKNVLVTFSLTFTR
ncbi:MAG: hypothetical protein J6K96_07080 [Treponema sp.]|nr:hypothetical protein [Treponema sp.]